MARPFTSFRFTQHARRQMRRRGLDERQLGRMVIEAEQWTAVRPGRVLIQGLVPAESGGKVYLVRVFVNVDRDPAEIVTAYRTSRIDKYGSDER